MAVDNLKMLGKLPESRLGMYAVVEDADLAARLLIMAVIFVVSLVAVSFPTITETYRSVRVPSVFFFVGKHFGTGVILATAFVHLLQDAFKALQDPTVNQRWKVDQWAGLIVLGSLLAIFLVEYISTAFVDRLHSYPSAPSSPTASAPSSSASSIQLDLDEAGALPPSARPSIILQSPHGTKSVVGDTLPRRHKHRSKDDGTQVGEFDQAGHPSAAPLPLAPPELTDEVVSSRETTPLNASTLPPPLLYGTTGRSSGRNTARPSAREARVSGSAADTFFPGGHHRHESRDSHAKHHARVSRWSWFGIPWTNREPSSLSGSVRLPSTRSQPSLRQTQPRNSLGASEVSQGTGRVHDGHAHDHQHDRGGRRHSHHSHGHGHGHADMERWIDDMDERLDRATSPISIHGSDEECGSDAEEEELRIGRRRQVIGILVLQMGIMIHSLVIGLTLSIASGPEFTSLVVAIVFHQLFEGLSLGIRIAGLPSKRSEDGFKNLPGHILKPLLAMAFAMTTPLGIGIGIAALSGAKSTGPRLMLVQGVMSAISAGMLIYAACVEMLAGDFVMDAHLWRSSVRRQVLALLSLFAGVAAMAAIGFLD
ncbi:Zinc/iron permease [Cubamyces menziesii]|nr:Zinc/iron permease [Cubamyces menziesii]